jgi:hypothetical protein
LRASIALALAVTVAACSNSNACASTAPCIAVQSAANTAAGSWREIESWRGLSIQISLTASDTTLAGLATYAVSGGTSGTANVTGYVFWQDSAAVPSGQMMPAHPVAVLHLAFSDGSSARFDQAVLRGQDTLSGALTFDDQPYSSYGATFVRMHVVRTATQAP